MTTVGHIESVWRYPVKSMRGEQLDEAYIGFAGVYGDRLYAFANSGAMKGFPFHTARQQERMLLYTPRFRDPEAAARPINVAEAHDILFGANPISPPPEALEVEVETPEGRRLAVTDPALLAEMASTVEGEIRLIRSERGLMDSSAGGSRAASGWCFRWSSWTRAARSSPSTPIRPNATANCCTT